MDYFFHILEHMDYPLPLIRLLLLSEHVYSPKQLFSIPHHQSLIRQHLQNPLKLKEILRCQIRKTIGTSSQIDLLELNENLKQFLRFEVLYELFANK